LKCWSLVVFFCFGCPLFGLLILLFSCHFPLLRLLLLLIVRVLIFIVITVVKMDMWRPFAKGSEKLRRLILVILHGVLVVLVLEDLRRVLLLKRHGSYPCYFVSHHLAPPTSLGVVGSVTQPYALADSVTASQSFTSGPPSAPSLVTCP
jgi:hypothetical protein